MKQHLLNADPHPTLTLRVIGRCGNEVVALVAGHEIGGSRPWFKVTLPASTIDLAGLPLEFPIFAAALDAGARLLGVSR